MRWRKISSNFKSYIQVVSYNASCCLVRDKRVVVSSSSLSANAIRTETHATSEYVVPLYKLMLSADDMKKVTFREKRVFFSTNTGNIWSPHRKSRNLDNFVLREYFVTLYKLMPQFKDMKSHRFRENVIFSP